MLKKEKYIISIVPLVKIPLYRDQFFYYTYHKKIPTGSLVKISLGKRTASGVVLESKSDFPRLGNIQLKKVISVTEENFITTKQLEVAQFISNYYLTSLGIVMKMFVPQVSGTRKTKCMEHKAQGIEHGASNKIVLTKEQKFAIKEITNSTSYKLPAYRTGRQATSYLLFAPASAGKTEVYIQSIQKIISKSPTSQALILIPELTIAAQEIERYGKFFGEEKVVTLHSKLSKGQFYKNWIAIKNGTAQIIIGTRQAVSAPFKNLKIIIVDEEQDVSFKQWEMNPHYDARLVALELASLHGAKIVFGSATPRIETYFRSSSRFAVNSSQFKYKLLTLPPLQATQSQVASTVTLVDLKNEHWKNWKKVKMVSPISEKLESELAWTLKNKFQSVLFINRQGMSTFSACTNCKTVLTCPDCERALTYRQKGNYECLHCKFETGDFPMCPSCQGISFRNVGLGTEKIENEIEKLFPSARIARVDSSSMRKSIKSQEKIWADFSSGKIDILIGTQMVAKAWDLVNVGLVGIIDADSFFTFPDFHTNEIAFSLISQAIGRTGRMGARYNGRALIQTYHPENQILKWAAERNYNNFYDYEIKERKALTYPPFSKIIKLTFKDFSASQAEKEVEKIYLKLKEALVDNNPTYRSYAAKGYADGAQTGIQIYPPQSPYYSRVRRRYQKQIIIRIKNDYTLPAPFLAELKALGIGWHIDVDPISLI